MELGTTDLDRVLVLDLGLDLGLDRVIPRIILAYSFTAADCCAALALPSPCR